MEGSEDIILVSHLSNIWQALQDVVSSKENIWKSCPSASACSGKMLELARNGGDLGLVGQIRAPRGHPTPWWCRFPRPKVWGHLQGHLELLQPLLLQLTCLEEELVALQPGRVDEQEGVGPLWAWVEAIGARLH